MQYLVSCCVFIGILASLAFSISSVVLGRAKRVFGTGWWEWLVDEFEWAYAFNGEWLVGGAETTFIDS